MAQITLFLLSALVAFNLFFHVAAAPIGMGFPRGDSYRLLNNPNTVDEATVTGFVVGFMPAESTAAIPEPTSTVTYWETRTVTEQPVATTTPLQAWVLPEVFTDLSPFGIERIAYGSPNIEVVTGIPARASATGAFPEAPTQPPSVVSMDSRPASPELPRPWTNSSTAYRLFFPSGSINPGNKPQGGSDFYAAPLSLQKATNVTLEYSVFFPADFEWVHGGKLPGLYGGHAGCSGGNDAKSCFSTRMMWRKGGAGELYLYAPKDKQTSELCQAPPQSVCDATYGLSIGRGSFHYTPGGWTHVRQTVRLNTPGKQDGGFELVVNGQRIMRRDDVFYRDVQSSPNHQGGKGGEKDGGDNKGSGDDDGGDNRGNGDNKGWNGGGDDGDGSDDDGGILGALLGGLMKRQQSLASEELEKAVLTSLLPTAQAPLFAPEAVIPDTSEVKVPVKDIDGTPDSVTATGTTTIALTATATSREPAHVPTGATSAVSRIQLESEGDMQNSIGFSGIFFSTFFGGHEQSWASPKDQYTYFKDFGLTVNA